MVKMTKPGILRYEEKAWASGALRLAGVDEAGRGPLAGPVFAAAVVFWPDVIRHAAESTYHELTDSKQMNEACREQLFALLREDGAVRIGTGAVQSVEIDRTNILRATHRAMAEAVRQVEADYALVDGLPVDGLPCESISIVKGDALSISISAASVVAKVMRDRLMVEMDACYPVYGFAEHKGYGTPAHLAALRAHGPCPAHRRSFQPVAALDTPCFL